MTDLGVDNFSHEKHFIVLFHGKHFIVFVSCGTSHCCAVLKGLADQKAAVEARPGGELSGWGRYDATVFHFPT